MSVIAIIDMRILLNEFC